jgi:hypothetical protein
MAQSFITQVFLAKTQWRKVLQYKFFSQRRRGATFYYTSFSRKDAKFYNKSFSRRDAKTQWREALVSLLTNGLTVFDRTDQF